MEASAQQSHLLKLWCKSKWFVITMQYRKEKNFLIIVNWLKLRLLFFDGRLDETIINPLI